MWWLVYTGLIIAMLAPMVGVVLGVRCYRTKEIGKGMACIVIGVALSLAFAAVSVYLVTLLLETSGIVTGALWFGIFGFILLIDLVYLRMMLFTKWAKRRMGIRIAEPKSRPTKVMSIDDIGKDWEKRIAEKKKAEEE